MNHISFKFDLALAETDVPASDVYIILELAQKGTLNDLMHRPGFKDVPVKTVLNLVLDMFVALAQLHSIGFMHCDIKPDIFFLLDHDTKFAEMKLGDFGLSLPMQYIGFPGRTSPLSPSLSPSPSPSPDDCCEVQRGTRQFWAPEVELRQGITPVSDVYSCARVALSLIQAKITWAPQSVRDEVPAQLLRLFRDALSQDPRDRPTVEELLNDIRRILVEEYFICSRNTLPF